jgi:hypothetical protein
LVPVEVRDLFEVALEGHLGGPVVPGLSPLVEGSVVGVGEDLLTGVKEDGAIVGMFVSDHGS